MNRAFEQEYRRAEYRIQFKDTPIILRVGLSDATAENAIHEHARAAATWAVITPCNPRSIALCEQENAARLENFHHLLQESGHRWAESTAHDPDGNWPDERGALIFGISLESARELGRRFDQNAILFGRSGEAPELVWL